MSDKHCFVVMGFGIKTDLATGRKLNLDKSYLALIKPVVEGKGIVCLRADEIKHSGSIDVPMYQQLLSADIVVADLSTANVNAFYELGIRHALRPRTTIIMSEEQMNYPFDLNHILINKYTHLGDNIDYFEVLRFQKLLGDTIDTVLNDDQPDSPVYTFLNDLIPPALKDKAESVAKQVGNALAQAQQQEAGTDNQTLSIIINQAEAALKQKKFAVAKGLFSSALIIAGTNANQQIATNNSYIIHRLAYATYKAEQPDLVAASNEAMHLLEQLDVQHTNDSETVILAGRIEKKLFHANEGEQHLSNAILYFERGCYLLNNRFNNINLSFLLNLRVDTSIYAGKLDKITDMMLANRIRQQVLSLCEEDMNKLNARKNAAAQTTLDNDSDLAASQQADDNDQQFWITVNKAEAHFGLRQMEEYEKARLEAVTMPHEDWMMEVFDTEITRLKAVLDKYGALLMS